MRHNQSWLWSLMVIIAVGVLGYGVFMATRPAGLPEGFLYGNGHMEGTEIRVASEVGGRVAAQYLSEGRSVSEGETVVVIDGESSRDRLQAAESELAALRESVAAIESQIEIWTHHVETAERQLQRVRELSASDLASERDVDQAEDGLREAEGQLRSLRSQRDALARQIEGAEARVDLAGSRVDRTVIQAPGNGTVLVRAVEKGEVVQPGQTLALLVDLARLELKVYLPERDIGKVALDNPARVRVDAFPDRYFTARVARVDDYAQFTPRDIHVPQERTRMVYGVTLALDNPDGRLKPGMPADAWIRWDASRIWPDRLPVPEG